MRSGPALKAGGEGSATCVPCLSPPLRRCRVGRPRLSQASPARWPTTAGQLQQTAAPLSVLAGRRDSLANAVLRPRDSLAPVEMTNPLLAYATESFLFEAQVCFVYNTRWFVAVWSQERSSFMINQSGA